MTNKIDKYQAYKPSGVEWIGEIPANWMAIRLKSILKDGREGIRIGPFGSALKSEILKSTGYKIYGQEHVIGNNFTMGEKYIDDIDFKRLCNYELFSKDIVITMMGTTGKCKVVPADIKKGIMDSHLIRIRTKECFSTPEFIALLINDSKYIFNQIKFNSKGSIMEGLNSSIVKSLILLLPPLPEQKAIANFLDRKTALIDQAINIKQKQIELLKERRQILIHNAVTRGLNPSVKMKNSGVEWIGEIPEHWEVKRLKFLGKIKYGLGQPPKEIENGLPLIRATNVERGIIVEKGLIYVDPDDIPWERNPMLKENDIIIVRSGAYTGDSAIVTKKHIGSIAGYDMVFTPISVNPLFISLVLLAKYVLYDQLYLVRMRAAQPHLNAEELGAILILYPPTKEQSHIEEKILIVSAKISEAISLKEKEIEKLKEYKATLINCAVTGKIKVN